MFFKRSKVDKSKAAETAAEPVAASAEAVEAGEAAPAETAEPATPIEPSLSLGAHTNAAGATDPASLGFKTTADLEPAHGPVGQAKAMEALAFGAGMKGSGYHMLVIGREGTGRRTAVRAKLQETARQGGAPGRLGLRQLVRSHRRLSRPEVAGRHGQALRREDGAGHRPARRRPACRVRRRRLRSEAAHDRGGIPLQPRGCAGSAASRGRVAEHRAAAHARRHRRGAGAGRQGRQDRRVQQSCPRRCAARCRPRSPPWRRRSRPFSPSVPTPRRNVARVWSTLNEQVAGRHVRAALDDIKSEFAEVAGVESYLKAAARDLVRNAGLFVGRRRRAGGKLTRGAAAHAALCPLRRARHGDDVGRRRRAHRAGAEPDLRQPVRSRRARRGGGRAKPGGTHQVRRAASRQWRLSAGRRRRAARQRGHR